MLFVMKEKDAVEFIREMLNSPEIKAEALKEELIEFFNDRLADGVTLQATNIKQHCLVDAGESHVTFKVQYSMDGNICGEMMEFVRLDDRDAAYKKLMKFIVSVYLHNDKIIAEAMRQKDAMVKVINDFAS